jgi:hypothetical protein
MYERTNKQTNIHTDKKGKDKKGDEKNNDKKHNDKGKLLDELSATEKNCLLIAAEGDDKLL